MRGTWVSCARPKVPVWTNGKWEMSRKLSVIRVRRGLPALDVHVEPAVARVGVVADLRDAGRRLTGAEPDEAVALGGVDGRQVGLRWHRHPVGRGRHEHAAAAAAEAPPVVRALQVALDQPPERQRRLAVGAAVGRGDDGGIAVPPDDVVAAEQRDADRLAGQVGAAGDCVPVPLQGRVVAEQLGPGHARRLAVLAHGLTV